MVELNDQQLKIRDFILRYQTEHGRRPTYEVIMQELGIRSTNTVHRCIRQLESLNILVLVYVVPPPTEPNL